MSMDRHLSGLALAMMALPFTLGAALCFLRPHWAWAWAIPMLVLPVWRLGVEVAGRVLDRRAAGPLLMGLEDTGEARKWISDKTIFASLAISVPMGIWLAGVLGLIDPRAVVISIRPSNVLAGMFMVILGNRLPKMLTPLSRAPCAPATIQTLRRRTGWAMVLSGLALIVLWLFLPVHLAMPMGIVVMFLPTAIMYTYYATNMR